VPYSPPSSEANQRWQNRSRRARRTEEGSSRGASPVRIEAEAPIVQSRNRLMEAQADQLLLSMGVISRETVASRHGYDWSIERDRIEAEGGPVPTGNPTGTIPPLES